MRCDVPKIVIGDVPVVTCARKDCKMYRMNKISVVAFIACMVMGTVGAMQPSDPEQVPPGTVVEPGATPQVVIGKCQKQVLARQLKEPKFSEFTAAIARLPSALQTGATKLLNSSWLNDTWANTLWLIKSFVIPLFAWALVFIESAPGLVLLGKLYIRFIGWFPLIVGYCIGIGLTVHLYGRIKAGTLNIIPK